MSAHRAWCELIADSRHTVPPGDLCVAVFDPQSLDLVGAHDADRSHAVLSRIRPTASAEIADALRRTASWSQEFRVELDAVTDVAAALCWDLDRRRAAVVVVSWPAERLEPLPRAPVPVSPTTMLTFVYDAEFRCTLADSRLALVGIDPSTHHHRHPLATIHPTDWNRIEPMIRAVRLSEAAEAEYVARVCGPGGAWFNHHCSIRSSSGADGPRFVSTLRALGAVRERIDPAGLTERDLAFVCDLFAGLGIDDIAGRHHLSSKTVRNLLSEIYRRLGVGSAREMNQRFDPPDRLLIDPIGLRVTPLVASIQR